MKFGDLKKTLAGWAAKLELGRPWDAGDDPENDLEMIRLREGGDSGSRGDAPTGEEPRSDRRLLMAVILGVVFVATIGFYLYNRNHTFRTYEITTARENTDSEGTSYAKLGRSIIKYSADGVFCVNRKNAAKWSSAFSMQAPITDICDDHTMVIAEQQGTQAVVFTEDGLLGSFETELPILGASVSRQGVTALTTADGEVTWITLYTKNGEKIAEVRTTVGDYGYPLDIAVSPNGKRLMVSFLGVGGGSIATTIAFFDFSSASGAGADHLTGSVEYPGQVFPELFYADQSTPVAVGDGGFIVFKNSAVPAEREKVTFTDEIVSTFHNASAVGFVFENRTDSSAGVEDRWRTELYSYTGKRMMQMTFDGSYSHIGLDGDEVLAWSEQYLMVFTRHGKIRFYSDFEEPVRFFTRLSGSRRFTVITRHNLNDIRIR